MSKVYHMIVVLNDRKRFFFIYLWKKSKGKSILKQIYKKVYKSELLIYFHVYIRKSFEVIFEKTLRRNIHC